MMPKVKGSHPWALILCNASDQPAPNGPGLDYFRNLIASSSANGLYAWWQQVSGGNLDFEGSNVFGWYGLSNTVAELSNMGRGQLVATARAAATTAGADVSGYLHTLAIVTGYPGSGNVGPTSHTALPRPMASPGGAGAPNAKGSPSGTALAAQGPASPRVATITAAVRITLSFTTPASPAVSPGGAGATNARR